MADISHEMSALLVTFELQKQKGLTMGKVAATKHLDFNAGHRV